MSDRLAFWAGVLPLELVASSPVDDPRLPPEIARPPSVRGWRRPRSGA